MEFEKRRQKEQIKMKDRHDIKNRGDGAKNTNPSDEVHPIKMTAALGAAKELDHVDDPDNQGDQDQPIRDVHKVLKNPPAYFGGHKSRATSHIRTLPLASESHRFLLILMQEAISR